MRAKQIVSIAFFVAVCSFARAAEIKGKVVSVGIFTVSGKEEIVKSPESPSGITRIPAGTPTLTTATNRIPARLGTRFGMWYEITNLSMPDGEIEVTKTAKHPPITKPDGTTSKGFTFVEKHLVKDGRVLGWTGYGFDHSYELVEGIWQFEMTVKGKAVCKQEFRVTKE